MASLESGLSCRDGDNVPTRAWEYMRAERRLVSGKISYRSHPKIACRCWFVLGEIDIDNSLQGASSYHT